jgi:hypothetical protein
LQVKLRGALVIRLQHVDRVIVEAKAAELTLIRADPSGDQWFLATEEVERLAQANGIPDEPPPTPVQRASTWHGLGVAAAVVLVLFLSIGVWLLLRTRRR